MSRDLRTDIQALRGLAVLLVVFYHADLGVFSAGYLGVDIFFVISGFLITGLIKNQIEQTRFSIWEFYYRRAKRLLPAAYVVIALTTLAAPLFLSDLGLREFRYQVLGALTFTGNIALWLQSAYFAGAAETKPLLHFWSLAVEEQYYLLLPAFLVLMPRRFWLMGLSALLVSSIIFCFYLASYNPSTAFYLLPTRFWEIAIGSIGALLSPPAVLASRISVLRLPALAVLFAIPIAPVGNVHPGLDAVLVCAATLTLLLAPTKDNVTLRGLAKIGDLSYSLYLIHWPVLVYTRAAWLTEPPAPFIYGALAFSFIGSWALYRFVEEPFRQGFFTSRRQLTSGLVAASVLLCLAPSIVIAATAGKVDFEKIRRPNHGLGPACVFRQGFPPDELPIGCRTTDKPELLIWGDSYAMALVPGLAKTAGETGIAQLTMSACGPTIGASPFEKGSAPNYPRTFAEDCIRFNDRVLDLLKSKPEIRVVAISSPFSALLASRYRMLVRRSDTFEEQDTSLALAVEGIKALIDEVRAAGRRVVVVAPPPSAGIDIGDCLERKARGRIRLGRDRDCQISVSRFRRSRSHVLAMLSELSIKANVEIVTIYEYLCDDKICKTEIDGKILYRDGSHLSYEGSEIIAHQTGLIQKILRAAK